jgi:hypothetical protein
MSESSHRHQVRSALDELKAPLAAFVASVKGVGVPQSQRAPDLQALLRAILDDWSAFKERLPSAARSWIHELKDFRNRWAHEETLTAADARRAGDTVALLIHAIAPRHDSAGRSPSAASTHGTAPRGRPSGRRITQRDLMIDVYARVGRNPDKAIAEYAAAERRGDIVRKSNAYGISAEDYARALLNDGLRKGWLK